MNAEFSVIIPLYNKEAEVAGTLRSVLAQTLPPLEIVVVDDGSTDRSAEVVSSIRSPLIRLIRQPNGGECAARNRAMREAHGAYFALIDADDEWEPTFLEEMARLVNDCPGCGIYSSAFTIIARDGAFPSRSPSWRGAVPDFFRESMRYYITIPSASVLPRRVVEESGGFPEGMKLGGDQYMWTKLASRYPVAFTPERLCRYSMVASNRSSAIYRAEQTSYSFRDFYDPADEGWRNEFIARVALGKALVLSAKGGTSDARSDARFFAYTRRSSRLLWKLRVLNALPAAWRGGALALYNRLAWRLARRGL